jgi:hypothetical protein
MATTFAEITTDFNTLLHDVIGRFFEGAINLKDEMQERIFDRTENTSGAKVQSVKPYSTNPIYVSKDSLPRKVSTTGKSGKSIESAYFPGGYNELKQAVGRPPLELTNRLKTDFLNQPIETTSNSVQFFLVGESAEKVASLNRLYDTVFAPSTTEIENYLIYISDAG